MNPLRLGIALIAAGLMLLICRRSTQPPEDPVSSPGQTAQQITVTGEKQNYLLFLPDNYAEKDEWPLIVYLHGASLRGHNPEKLKRYGLPKMLNRRRDFPAIVLSPQCPPGQGWHQQDWLPGLIDKIIQKHTIDDRRVYLTGVSLGGNGTWFWAAQLPGKFAAIIPLCGYGNPETAEALKEVPVWTFHGEKDRIVAIKVTEEMVKALQKAGGKVRFTRFPDRGHNIVEQVYQDQKVFDWLFKQRR